MIPTPHRQLSIPFSLHHTVHNLVVHEWGDAANPKVIICEGKRAYLNVIDCIDLEIDKIHEEKTIFFVTFKNSNIFLIGYSRRYSKILNKDVLTNIIKEKV